MLNESLISALDAASLVGEMSIMAEPHQIRDAALWLDQLGQERGVPDDQRSRLDLCLNEALANILDHGGESALSEPIWLQLFVGNDANGSVAKVTVADAGVAFDLLGVAAKPAAHTLAEAQPGGLGLLMLRQFSDHLDYVYRDGRNHLSFTTCWVAEA